MMSSRRGGSHPERADPALYSDPTTSYGDRGEEELGKSEPS